MITIVGLGNKKGDLTANGKRLIKNANKLFVRTLLSEAGKQVKRYKPVSMDDLYNSCGNFDILNEAIADRVIAADDADLSIVYCVDGDGYSDSSVLAVQEKTDRWNCCPGVSDSPPVFAVDGLQTYSAFHLKEKPFWPDTSFPLIVRGITDRFIAGEVKLWLLRFYGGEEKVFLLHTSGAQHLPLTELDHAKKYNHNAYVFIPAQKEFKKPRYNYPDLMRIMTRLIAPDGCPWDREQTHESISKNMTEEAQELVDAITLGDIDNMEEESGDVLLQAVFHGFIGEKYGEFTADDVVNRLCQKLVSRHTHVFGENKAENAQQALAFWKEAKRKEKEKEKTDGI